MAGTESEQSGTGSPLQMLSRRALPLVADGSAIAGFFFLVGPLSQQFEKEEALNAGLLGGSYLILCGSVYVLRRTEARRVRADEAWTYLLVALAIAYSIYVLAMSVETSGLSDALETMDSSLGGTESLLLMAGTMATFGLLILYPAMFLLRAGPAFRVGSWGMAVAELAALLGANLAVVVSVAQWEAFFADVEPYESVTAATKALIFLPTLAFFLVFYGSPRLLFLLCDGSRVAVGTFLAESGVVTWAALERSAW